jgi:hypothetical protein
MQNDRKLRVFDPNNRAFRRARRAYGAAGGYATGANKRAEPII